MNVPDVTRDSSIPASKGPPTPTKDWGLRQRWPLFLAVCVALGVWCAVDVCRRARLLPDHPERHRTDLTVYTTAGAAFFDDRDPYQVTNVRGWHYLYPPLFAILISPLHHLLPETQAGVWFALSAALCLGSFFECRRIVRCVLPDRKAGPARYPRLPTWMGIGAFLAVLLPTLNCLQRGQVGVAVVYLLLLGFRLVLTGRTTRAWLLGGFVLAAPVALKLTPILPVGFLMLAQAVVHLGSGTPGRNARRAAAPSIGVLFGLVAFLFLIPALFVGWDRNLGHLNTWIRRVVVTRDVGDVNEFNVLSKRNQSMSNAVFHFGNWAAHLLGDAPDDGFTREDSSDLEVYLMDHHAVSAALNVIRAMLMLLLAACGWWLMRRGGPLEQATSFGLACAATLLISPLSWGHHYIILLPAALFVPLWFWENGSHRTAMVGAAVPGALSFLHYTLLDFAGRIGVLGIGTTLWFIGACLIVLASCRRGSRGRRRPVRVPDSVIRRRGMVTAGDFLLWLRTHRGVRA